MVESSAGTDPLVGLPMRQLRDAWEKADGIPGEQVTIRGFGSVTKGELAVAIAEKEATRPIKPRRHFHPIDGSRRMRPHFKIGQIIDGSRW